MKDFLFTGTMDWKALQRQKLTLLTTITLLEQDNKKRWIDDLTAIVHVLDKLQDDAVASGIYTEKEVFNL